MRQSKIILFLLALLSFPAFSQAILSYSINNGTLPNDSDHITVPPSYIDSSGQFLLSGFQANQVVPDFTLFDTLGNPTTLSTALNLGKPVLLACVSFSCPSSRHCISNVLNDIHAQFGTQITILLVYILEAHPLSPDISPYAHTVWEVPSNAPDSALIRQETNYAQRKQECAAFINRFNVCVPVLIDGQGNEYWLNFGPSPNGAYLIDTHGMVYRKYGWFDQSENDLRNDIPTLLLQSGINESINNSSAAIFPNPSRGNSFLQVENESSYNFRIIDMMGRIVASEENVSNSISDLEKYHLDAGVYSVMVETKSGRTFELRYMIQ